LVSRHRDRAAALHPALDRAALRPQTIACRGTGYLLITTRTGIVITAIAVTGDRLIIVTGTIRRDRLVIRPGLIRGHRLVVAALDVARRTNGLGAGTGTGIAAGIRHVKTSGGGGRAMRPANLEDIAPGPMSRDGTSSKQHQ